jgi:hypothetical protein
MRVHAVEVVLELGELVQRLDGVLILRQVSGRNVLLEPVS